MSVSVENGLAILVAPSRVEDAEPLWRFLHAERAAGRVAAVDLSAAGLPHAAVMQLLLLFRPAIRAGFDDPFARAWAGVTAGLAAGVAADALPEDRGETDDNDSPA